MAAQRESTTIWWQNPNPVPRNRLCLHIKHKLECAYFEFACGGRSRERTVLSEPHFREQILRRDNYTCQACGYKQTWKPQGIKPRAKEESDGEYLLRRSLSTLSPYDHPKESVVAYYIRRYLEDTYDSGHKLENARTLCEDCHNWRPRRTKWSNG